MSVLSDHVLVDRDEQFKLPQLRLRELGISHVPAVPVDIAGMVDTLVKLGIRAKQYEMAYQGLTKTFTISGTTARAHSFLFGTHTADAQRAAARAGLQAFLSSNPLEIPPAALAATLKSQDEQLAQSANGSDDGLTGVAIEDPKQWSMSWTTFPDVHEVGLPRLEEWARTVDVTMPDEATRAFFPNIAREGLAYNLLLLNQVRSADLGTWRDLVGSTWTGRSMRPHTPACST